MPLAQARFPEQAEAVLLDHSPDVTNIRRTSLRVPLQSHGQLRAGRLDPCLAQLVPPDAQLGIGAMGVEVVHVGTHRLVQRREKPHLVGGTRVAAQGDDPRTLDEGPFSEQVVPLSRKA